PVTCWAFRARSSLSTPAVFLAATLVMTDTSSSMLAISSSKAKKLLPAMMNPDCKGSGDLGLPRQGAAADDLPAWKLQVAAVDEAHSAKGATSQSTPDHIGNAFPHSPGGQPQRLSRSRQCRHTDRHAEHRFTEPGNRARLVAYPC